MKKKQTWSQLCDENCCIVDIVYVLTGITTLGNDFVCVHIVYKLYNLPQHGILGELISHPAGAVGHHNPCS